MLVKSTVWPNQCMLSVEAIGRGSGVATSCDTVACDTFRTDARRMSLEPGPGAYGGVTSFG